MMTLLVFAGIDDGWDWKGQKRKLKVWYHFDATTAKLGDQLMKAIIDDALKEWNDVKADTGWEFTSDDGSRSRYRNRGRRYRQRGERRRHRYYARRIQRRSHRGDDYLRSKSQGYGRDRPCVG